MASDPERPIETLLRKAAQQRREAAGEPAPMHPVTRRLLQAEVRRQYPAAAEPVRRPFRLWPTLAWSLGLATILALPLFLWLSGSPRRPARELTLAKSESVSEASRVRRTEREPLPPVASPTVTANRPPTPASPLPAAAPAPQPSAEAEVASRRSTADMDANVPAKPVVAGVAAAPAAVAPSVPSEAALAERSLADRASPAQGAAARRYGMAAPSSSARPMAAPAAPSNRGEVAASAVYPEKGVADEPVALDKALRSSKQVTPAATAAILTAFRVEQSGRELRIVDGDGSVYTGRLEAPEPQSPVTDSEAAPKASAARVEPRLALAKEAGRAGGGPQTFRVTGTNLTSHQLVVLAGKLVGDPTGMNFVRPTGYLTNRSRGVLAPSPKEKAMPAQRRVDSRVRISGTVTIGEGQPIELEAGPARP